MVNKNKLDNLSAEEIKEMITAEAILFESLDSLSLEKLLAFETEMLCHGSGDMEFISRCAQRLTVLGDYATKSAKTTSDFASLVDNTITENLTILPAQQTQTKNTQKQRRFPLKRIAIIAAAIIIATTATVVSTTSDNYWGWNLVKDKEVGYTIEYSGISCTRGGTVQHYSSLEEIIKEKNWNILYPTKLPQDINIDKIRLGVTPRWNDEIHIITSNPKIAISIEKNIPKRDSNEQKLGEQESIYETNGIKYLVFPYNDVYYAVCYYNGDYYSIQAETYDDLILIIENLKEIEK